MPENICFGLIDKYPAEQKSLTAEIEEPEVKLKYVLSLYVSKNIRASVGTAARFTQTFSPPLFHRLSMIKYNKCCAIIKKAAEALSQNIFCGKSSSAGCAVQICRARREHHATEQSCTIINV